MTIAPAEGVENSYRVIEHEGFVEVELLAPKLPEELGEALINEAVRRRWSCLLLDCSRVQFLTSLGLGSLIRLDRQLRPMGGKLRVCGLNAHLAELFTITRIDRVMQICSDREEGLALQW